MSNSKSNLNSNQNSNLNLNIPYSQPHMPVNPLLSPPAQGGLTGAH